MPLPQSAATFAVPSKPLRSSARRNCNAKEQTRRPSRRSRVLSNSSWRDSSSDSSCSDTENKVVHKLLSSPRKNKLEENAAQDCPITPPKQKRKDNIENIKCPKTPSSLIKDLSIHSPKKSENEDKFTPKKLFQHENSYQMARKALHGTYETQMPGREKELKDLRDFIETHLKNGTSGTLYVSGPPGTGKTASLSKILDEPKILCELKKVYVNCTSIKSSGSIYSRIVKELGLKSSCRTEKDYLATIENHLSKNHKTILLVLDELDQLESKKQSILYSIFEWPAKPKSKLILIGIANALDLTDRILPRLQARCELKPKLMHFAPYTKQQIVEIFTDRLKQAGVVDIFSPVAVQMLAGKVAAISGDVRRALDIGRRVIELVEQNKKADVLRAIDNISTLGCDITEDKLKPQTVDLKQVVDVLNNVYGTTQNLENDTEDAFPLQQKIVICTLVLILKKAKNKDVTVGKLHDIYRKICSKRNLLAVDQAEFVGLCSLIETKGIIRISGKKEPRLNKVHLEWDEEEVSSALCDKQLMSTILQDGGCLGKL